MRDGICLLVLLALSMLGIMGGFLKAFHVIHCSWWVAFSPLLVAVVIIYVVMTVCIILALMAPNTREGGVH